MSLSLLDNFFKNFEVCILDRRQNFFFTRFQIQNDILLSPTKTCKLQSALKIDLKTLRHYFFSAKVERLLFSYLMSGGPRGDLGSVNFSLKSFSKLEFFGFKVVRQVEILCCQVPPRSPRHWIWKEQHLSFHWKKINVVAFLDQFLNHLKFAHFGWRQEFVIMNLKSSKKEVLSPI